MSPDKRRASLRRKAWGRGPMILRFEPLETRALLSLLGTDTEAAALSQDLSLLAAETPVVLTTTTTASTTDSVSVDAPAILPDATASDLAADSTPIEATTTPNLTTTTPVTTRSDLTITAFDTLHNLDWGQTFRAVGIIRNAGLDPAPAGIEFDIVASPTPSIGPSAVYVGTGKISQEIKPGAEATFDIPMDAPPAAFQGYNGTSFYLVPLVDPTGRVIELDETNNGGRGGDPNSFVTVTTQQQPVIQPTAFSIVPVNAGQAYWGGTVQAVIQVTNTQANTLALPTRARIVLAPAGQAPDSTSAVTIGELRVPALQAGATATVRGTIYLSPKAPPTLANQSQLVAYLITDADYQYRAPLSSVSLRGPGLDSTTLSIVTPTTSTTPAANPEITVRDVTTSSNIVTWSKPFAVQATIQNTGQADSGPVRVRFVLGDSNRPYAAPLALADVIVDNLPAGTARVVQAQIEADGKLPDGLNPEDVAGRIIVLADPENSVIETSDSNNGLASTPVRLKLLARETTTTTTTTTTPTTNTTTNPTPRPASQTTTPKKQTNRLTLAAQRKAAKNQAARAKAAVPKPPAKTPSVRRSLTPKTRRPR